ncbi:phosphate ABC transporter substrate-binding protein [Hydrogenophaga sp. Root209]|uniref:phosphate ABC transporter substrate-binding protein PstS n=1 Tax=Hydrogenophaga sp. Root209 TaxID=1736490 RepID=UPI0006FB4AAA|nr:phosphate ABC transporter substrate-binding protein PstS [Hydrogenophaga sp. Root209]KRB96945.1 phosphate ABC transporter substrate-binding protein [Hydrogenophaga sp. Root209]
MKLHHFRGLLIAAGTTLCTFAASAQDITGAGATFPAPAYAKWADAFKTAAGAKVNYQAIGSSGGIRQIDGRTVDFGATDAPLKDDELTRKGQIQFPTLIGGVVPVVNLRGVAAGQLRLTGAVLGDIYLGKISRWSDPAIVALNPQLPLPDTAITPVFRSDGSGTSFIFTNYLSKVNADWKSRIGEGTQVGWPTGSGGRGNIGVAAIVSRTPNAIGYVEYAYVKQAKLNFALLQNASGAFVAPGTEAFRAASTGVDWTTSHSHMLTQQPAPEAWPITGATFVLMYAKVDNVANASQALRFFHWGLTTGESMTTELGYAALPKPVVDSIEALWSRVRDASGKSVAYK